MSSDRRRGLVEGPGANHLRGGKHIYSSHTKVGNWVEDDWNPLTRLVGFTNEKYITTTRQQQLDALPRTGAQLFGGGLPEAVYSKIDFSHPFAPDTSLTEREWVSTSQAQHTDPVIADLGKRSQIRREHADKYRASWTNDTSAGRAFRFTTTSMLAANQSVADRFQRRQVRKLAGTPLAVEKLRDKLVERCGGFALLYLWYVMRSFDSSGEGLLQAEEFSRAIREVGVDVSTEDLNSVMYFFDKTAAGVIDLHKLVSDIRLPSSRARMGEVRRKFCEVFQTTEAGLVSEERVLSAFDPRCFNGDTRIVPAVSRKIQELSSAHPRVINLEGFLALHTEISACYEEGGPGDTAFEELLHSMWH